MVQRGTFNNMLHPHKIERSPKWATVRRRYLVGKSCGICGGMKKREVHHIKPFHLYPELELEESNLFVLCEGNKNVNCHLIFGHYGNYRTKFNGDIKRFAATFKSKLIAK